MSERRIAQRRPSGISAEPHAAASRPKIRSASCVRQLDEVKTLRDEAHQLKETLAEVLIENRLLKKSVIGDGELDT